MSSICPLPGEKEELLKLREGLTNHVDTLLFNGRIPEPARRQVAGLIACALAREIITSDHGRIPAVNNEIWWEEREKHKP